MIKEVGRMYDNYQPNMHTNHNVDIGGKVSPNAKPKNGIWKFEYVGGGNSTTYMRRQVGSQNVNKVPTQSEPNHVIECAEFSESLCSAATAISGDVVEGGARISVPFTHV